MTNVGIIIGSTRPGRNGEQVARWVQDIAVEHAGREAGFELVDLKDHGLPLLDEPVPALAAAGTNEHTVRWAQRIGSFDAYVIVTPEYNGGAPAALCNALDYLYQEWVGKAVAFVGYGVHGALIAVQQLRGTAGRLKMMDIGTQVALTLREDFVDGTTFKPQQVHMPEVHELVDELLTFSRALSPLRAG